MVVGFDGCSTLSGDAPTRSCAAYCTANNKGRRYCRHCACSACSFCTPDRPPLVLPTPAAVTASQLRLSRAALASVRKRYLSQRGVVMRLWECSLAGCVGRGDDPGGNQWIERCVLHELQTSISGQQGFARPASFLRWDAPAAIFAGGRCTSPAGHEWQLYPEAASDADEQRQDHDGWQREGFVGSNATIMGIGWVLRETPRERREAFPHDSWTQSPRRSGTHAGMAVESCVQQLHNPAPYARARLAALRAAARADGRLSSLGTLAQRLAASYKWNFVNTSANCFHWHWEDMVAQQRKFAMLRHTAELAGGARNASPPLPPVPPACNIWGSLYNQVHVGWNSSMLEAIFYVNDTLTAQLLSPSASASASGEELQTLRRRLARDALGAAQRARTNALLAQHILASRLGLAVPVIQYVYTDECFRSDRLVARLGKKLKGANSNTAGTSTNGSGKYKLGGLSMRPPAAQKAAQRTAAAVFRVLQ